MNRTLLSAVAVPILLISAAAARADYSAGVLSLGPVGYWPLNETNQPPQTFSAHNSGTLGAQANGYYNDVYVNSGANYTLDSYFTGPVPGVTSDGDAGAFFNGGTNGDDNDGYMIVPDINSGMEKGGGPFTAEVWVKPEGGDPNDVTGTSYASTEWTSLMAKGGGGLGYATKSDSAGDTFGWSIELAGIYCLGYYTNGPIGWYTPGPVFYTTNALWVVDFYGGNNGQNPSLEFMVPMYEPTPQWFHLVLTYDGTNANFYTNGVLAATTLPNLPQSTNYVTEAGTGAANTTQNYEFQTGYTADTNNPMVVGNINPQSSIVDSGFPSTASGTIGFNCQNFNGVVDELAYYTNAISAAAVLQHYSDATAANTKLYTNDVFSLNPLVYLRFDDPQSVFTQPPVNFSTFPVATNYGSIGITANGLYQAGTIPKVPGTPEIGFGSNTNAVQINGLDAGVDVGGGHLSGTVLDPKNLSSMTLTYWFKANPADCYGRFQTIVGRGDSGWRSSLDTGGHLRWNPGAGPELSSPGNYDDGLWHQFVGVADGSSGTVTMYVDGQLSTSSTGMGSMGGSIYDLLIGGAPDYTDTEPSRYFAGQLAQVAFFTNAFSVAQVEALYDDATNLAPIITGLAPTSLSMSATLSGSLTVVASGQPVTYQWYQGATKVSNVPGNISGATNATLAFNDAVPANQGNYTVVVANGFGSVTSVVATVTVVTNAEIVSDISDTNLTLFAGGNAIFSVGTAGAPPITYQWYSNTVAITGATGSSYNLVNAQPANATNFYYCVAKNLYVSATSSVAQVSIIPDPTASYPRAVLAANPVGFWRLNEGPDNGSGNAGVVAHDYWGGNNGIYTNVNLAQVGYNINETNETSVLFGALTFQDGDVFAIPTTVDFSATNGAASNFSIEAWVRGGAGQQTVDAGLVSKGWGGGGEEFNMDCGNDATNAQNLNPHSYRFFVRDASGNTHGVGSNVNPSDDLWHHLVGVVNESQGYVAFYVDGILAGTNTIGTTNGILSSSRSMLIGSRPSTQTTNDNDDEFFGWIDDVAVYNYALTATAVSNQFVSAAIPAFIAVQPGNVTVGQNGNATFSAVASGTPAITYQWYNAGTGQPVPASATQGGSTNATLILTDVQTSASYYLIVNNAYGSGQSVSASLTVVSGLAQIYTSPQLQYFAFEGEPLQISTLAYGTLPLTYQWQYSPTNAIVWTSLTDNGNTVGSESNVLTLENTQPANAGYYQLVINNSFGSVTSIVAEVTVGTLPVSFNGDGLGWSSNSVGTYFVPQITTNGVLYLTDTNGSESRSSFFPDPLYVGAFEASFTYQTPSRGGADGMAFCIQNDPRGPSALGGGGGSLGVSGITPSVELELNLYTGNTEQIGYTVLTNGLTGSGGANGNYQKPGNVSINGGDPINIIVYYANGQADITFTDAVASTSYSTSYAINIPSTVGGNTAYVGFTGADGGATSVQTISNFSFVSLANESILASGTNVVISWPTFAPGYVLQSSTNLVSPVWVNVANAPVTANGEFKVTVPAGKGAKFYRLSLP